MKKGRLIIISAPSGCGKSTIISRIIDDPELRLGFSISATTRAPREGEKDGREYYFLKEEDFQRLVAEDKFIEWEEVYAGTCYGTLASEVERVTDSGRNLILDIDVAGALNVKKRYGQDALSVFILPPDTAELERRLRGRGTDSEETISRRLAKADREISFSPQFDKQVVNDDLEKAVNDVRDIILDFIK